MSDYIPDYRAKSIFEIDYDRLKKLGIRGILIDIDNTLVPMHTKVPTEDSANWARRMVESGFKVCILSNANHERTALFKDILSVTGVGMAFKPRKKGYMKALQVLSLESEQCVMIGDQLLTDIKGGNKMKMMTVLTEVLDKKEHWYVRLKRVIENLFLRKQLEKVEWI